MTVKSVGIGMGATVLTQSPGSSLRRESKPWGIWVEEIESAVAHLVCVLISEVTIVESRVVESGMRRKK